MTFREDAIQATEDIIDALGEPVGYTPKGGSLVTITAVFESEYIEQQNMAGMMPTMAVKSSDGTFQEGDVFRVDSVNYAVVVTEPDEDGQTKCFLEKRP